MFLTAAAGGGCGAGICSLASCTYPERSRVRSGWWEQAKGAVRFSAVTERGGEGLATGQLHCDSHPSVLSADSDVELMVRANHNDVSSGQRLPRDPHSAIF